MFLSQVNKIGFKGVLERIKTRKCFYEIIRLYFNFHCKFANNYHGYF